MIILDSILIFAGENATGESEDLLTAVQRLAQLTILLDQVDSRINCNCLEYLLNELCNKTSLISERDAQEIITKRFVFLISSIDQTKG